MVVSIILPYQPAAYIRDDATSLRPRGATVTRKSGTANHQGRFHIMSLKNANVVQQNFSGGETAEVVIEALGR